MGWNQQSNPQHYSHLESTTTTKKFQVLLVLKGRVSAVEHPGAYFFARACGFGFMAIDFLLNILFVARQVHQRLASRPLRRPSLKEEPLSLGAHNLR